MLTSVSSHAVQSTAPTNGSVVQSGTFNTLGSDNDVKCSLNDPNDNAVTASEATADGFNYTDAVPYTLVATMSLPSGGTITVDCATLTGTVGAEVDFNEHRRNGRCC